MTQSDSVVLALTRALAAAPDDEALRLHLADLLLERERFGEALEHYQKLLLTDPVHRRALEGACRAAAGAGNERQAAGYRAILAASAAEAAPPAAADIETTAAAAGRQPSENDANSEDVAEDDDEDDDFEDDVIDTDEMSDGSRVARIGGDRPRLRLVGSKQYNEEIAETPKLTLSDVGGLDDVKKRINISFLAPLRNPALREQYGLSLRGGLLLYGPPGCGKTFIARAVAGELGARFYSIGLNDVMDMWFGESERKLHELFETARRHAPSVLFFDEIDALGHKRANLRGGAGRNLVNALLSELDGVDALNEGLFVLAATNHPWDVDEALRRPGRFDRTVLVLPPDPAARESILAYHLKQYPAEKLDLRELVKQTDEFSGADLQHLCKCAAEAAIEEALERGKVRPLEMKDFKKALKDVRASVRPWFATAKNYAMFANEGGQYDDLLGYIKTRKY